MLTATFASVLLFQLVSASAVPPHSDVLRMRNAGTWHHPRDHPIHNLFTRQAAAATYPGEPDMIDNIPAEWKAALDAAIKENKIPNVPVAHLSGDAVTYPGNLDAGGNEVCASAAKECRIDGDLWDAPDGVFASSFDDGPLEGTPKLVEFLSEQKVTTTHFMIGSNILANPQWFKLIVDNNNDLAVHTWSHRHSTTLSNEDLAGELGWTIQIIYDQTGKVPRFWRPPYGESDRRVGAIAKEVFGLTTVIWNHDTDDWKMADAGAGPDAQRETEEKLAGFLASPKSPGLMVLEHENNERDVDVFISQYPKIAQNGWKFQSLASSYGGNAYSTENDVIGLFGDVPVSSSAPPAASSTAAPADTNTQAQGTTGTRTGTAASSSSTGQALSQANTVGASTLWNDDPYTIPIFALLVVSVVLTLGNLAFAIWSRRQTRNYERVKSVSYE